MSWTWTDRYSAESPGQNESPPGQQLVDTLDAHLGNVENVLYEIGYVLSGIREELRALRTTTNSNTNSTANTPTDTIE